MAWKPKAKTLTAEEAMARAKKELAPLWFGSEPLVLGVAAGERTSLYPLNSEFQKKSWLIFLVDPLTFSGEAALRHAREWHRRYRLNDLGVIVVIRPYHRFMQDPEFVTGLMRKFQLSQFFQPAIILTLDQGGLLSSALGGKELPKILIMHAGRFILEQAGAHWKRGAEQKIQDFLRSRDPGLPLLPLFEAAAGRDFADRGRIDFSTWERYPKPGFQPVQGGMSAAHFGNSDRAGVPTAGDLFIRGGWARDQDRIITSDPSAEIRVRSPGSDFSLVASTVSQTAEVAEIAVEAGDDPAYDEIEGDDIVRADNGSSMVKAVEARLYSALAGIPESRRDLRLRFPNADRVPVALYGLRFGS